MGSTSKAAPSSTEPGEGVEVVNAGELSPSTPTPAPANDDNRPDMDALHGVRYTGPYDRKILTTDDLRKMGVSSPQTDLVFEGADKSVVLTDINAETVNALLETGLFETF